MTEYFNKNLAWHYIKLAMPLSERENLKRAFDKIPTADVQEVKHGKWIKEHFDSESGEFYHTCSKCGMELKETYLDNYCPNCGVKMTGR